VIQFKGAFSRLEKQEIHMKKEIARILLLLGVAGCAARGVQAGQYLVVTRSSAGAWSFQDVESLTVNGKEKVRSTLLSEGSGTAWDSKSVNRLAEAHISSFGIVRRTPEGEVLGRTGDSDNWQRLLPEGTNAKAADTAAHLWSGSALAVKSERKDKSASAIKLEELYAIIPTRDASASAASLAIDISLHKLPGASEPDAFRQMLDLLPSAAKAFPPSSKTIQDYLNTSMTARLKEWQDGNVPLDILDRSLQLATAADAAFPNDPILGPLSSQARTVRKALDRRVGILRALDAGKQSDAFLVAYRGFEVYDKSFPELAKARAWHLHASAVAHVETARALQQSGDYLGAIRHLLIAKWHDPKLKDADDMLEQVRLEAARLSVQKFAEKRRGIDPRSPAQVQLQRKLLLAEQQMNDGKIAEAEKTLDEAERMDKEEPRLTLLQARLSVARGDLGKALAQLDNFDGVAVTAQDFAEGEKLRASVQYTIDTSLGKKRAQAQEDLGQQRFAAALEASADGLRLDNENPDLLYYASLNACVLRHCDKAEPLLRRYLDITDSTQGSRDKRLAAMQLLQESFVLEAETKTPEAASTSWFSGAPLARGVFYDPVSLSFQPKVAHIEASDHLNIFYEWSGGQLHSVHAKHEEKQTASNIMRTAAAAAVAAGGITATAGWKTAQRETNDFFFNYYDDMQQVLKVSREKAVVKSRTIPITIPGIGIFGPFSAIGAVGALGSLASLAKMTSLAGKGGIGAISGIGATKGLSAPGSIPGLGSMGALGGMGGAANSAILSRLAGSGRMSGLSGFSSLSTGRPLAPSQKYSVLSDPEGGSSAGFLTLWNNPRLDTRLAFKMTGKRAAIGFSGNAYFHPFVWDAIHLFELDYDEQGRVLHAWELDNPSAPRLDFAWDGQRLLKVTGHDSAGAVVYSRTLNYSGDRLTGEAISGPGGASHIEYKYDKQGRMVEASANADRSLDGRSRKVFFVEEDKGKR
jgi:hypothetical protein